MSTIGYVLVMLATTSVNGRALTNDVIIKKFSTEQACLEFHMNSSYFRKHSINRDEVFCAPYTAKTIL